VKRAYVSMDMSHSFMLTSRFIREAIVDEVNQMREMCLRECKASGMQVVGDFEMKVWASDGCTTFVMLFNAKEAS